MLALAALTAAQIFIHAPQQALGATRADVERKLGPSVGVGTDLKDSPFVEGSKDEVVTLDYPGAQVRLYLIRSDGTSALLAVTTARNLFPTAAGIGMGSDRGSVLRELGGPAYEDDDQVIYVDPHPDDPTVEDRVRFVLEADRVVGIDWRFVVGRVRR